MSKEDEVGLLTETQAWILYVLSLYPSQIRVTDPNLSPRGKTFHGQQIQDIFQQFGPSVLDQEQIRALAESHLDSRYPLRGQPLPRIGGIALISATGERTDIETEFEDLPYEGTDMQSVTLSDKIAISRFLMAIGLPESQAQNITYLPDSLLIGPILPAKS